jgi:hypothetical protein
MTSISSSRIAGAVTGTISNGLRLREDLFQVRPQIRLLKDVPAAQGHVRADSLRRKKHLAHFPEGQA